MSIKLIFLSPKIFFPLQPLPLDDIVDFRNIQTITSPSSDVVQIARMSNSNTMQDQDGLAFQIEVISFKLEAVSSELEAVSSELDAVSSKLDAVSSKLDSLTREVRARPEVGHVVGLINCLYVPAVLSYARSVTNTS